MRYKIIETVSFDTTQRHVIVETAPEQYTSFPAIVGNSAFDGFIEQTGVDVETAPLDVWTGV